MTDTSHSFRVEALVLRHSNFSEADRLLTLFTRERGKLHVVAKGVRKLKSRKAGHLEPFTRVQLQLARGQGMPIIAQAETMEAYSAIRADLDMTARAAYVLEVLDRFTYDEEEHPQLFQLAVETLERLNAGVEAFFANRYFELHALNTLGFRPELFACVSCRQPVQPVDQYFSARRGGVVCPNCALRVEGVRPVSVDTLRFLRHFQRSSFKEARRADPRPAQREEMEALLQYYIHTQMESRLNTPGFIRAISA